MQKRKVNEREVAGNIRKGVCKIKRRAERRREKQLTRQLIEEYLYELEELQRFSKGA